MNTNKIMLKLQEHAMDKILNRNFQKICCILFIAVIWLCGCKTYSTDSKHVGFSSYDDAAAAFVKALRENNNDELIRIFGPDAEELIWSGDKVRDRQRREAFLRAYDQQHKIDREGDKTILVIGRNEWPFPIPIVQENGKWVFDTAAGKEEVLDRRIGRNELDTIQTMLAIVDAQNEYARETAGNGVRQYAQKFRSDPGQKNGLYWQTSQGEQPSPLGPLVAEARQEGYFNNATSEQSAPYHGYFYRILPGQGEHAQDGAYDYIVDGKMIGGFGVVAYPVQYGNSGIMTFIVNHDGVVYQKDLGSNTEQKAKAMKLFDPDKTWAKVKP